MSIISFTKCSLAVLIAGSLLGGCGSADSETVGGSGAIYDRTTSAILAANLASIEGTFGAGCTDHTGGETWTLNVAGGGTLDDVVKNDVGCVLTVTGVTDASAVLYVASPPIAMTGSYQVSASSFRVDGLGAVIFYANAMVTPADFSDDFVIDVLYSDDPSIADATSTATYAVQSATVNQDTNPSPSYTLSALTSLDIQTDDAQVVQTATGQANLVDGAVTGQHYVIFDGSVASTYGAIDTAYLAGGTPVAIGANPSILAASFTLVGDTLPQVRSIIIARTENGVRAYQVFRVTFGIAS